MNYFDDPEALVEANKLIGVDSEYSQIKRGRFRSNFTTSPHGDIVCVNEWHKTAVRIRAASSVSDFLLFMNSTARSKLVSKGRVVVDTRLNIAAPRTELFFSTSGSIHAPQMSIPAAKLLQSLSARTQKDIYQIDDVLDKICIDPVSYQSLSDCIIADRDIDIAYETVVEKIYGALVSKPEISYKPRRGRPLSNNLSILNRAIDFIHANVQNAVSIESICVECECSQSNLERIFVKYMSTTPKRYVMCHKLQVARKELTQARRSDLHVVDVANKFGFNHSGRFSGYYRDFFREYPHETLERSAAS